MKNILYVIIGVWLSVSTTQEAKAQQTKNSLLWEISGNGLSESSYLYGTIHIICPDDFEIGTHVDNAFAKTKRLVMELNMSDASEMNNAQQLMRSPEPVDYKALLTEAQYNKLDAKLTERMGAGMAFLNVMKPFALSSLLQLTVMDCQETASYETTFMEMANAQQNSIEGLETAAFQMSIFDNIPQEEQIEWIVEYLDNEEKGKTDWKKMVKMYKSKDVEAIGNSLNDFPEYKKYEDELLTKRNQRWIPKIEKMAKEQPIFVAVGAAHLGGNNGVIKLLQQAGYTLKPVIQ